MNTAARHAAPLGTGHLHDALEGARDLAALNAFCAAQACTPAEVSSDGRRLDMLRIFDLMRSRGYDVSQPVRPQHQPRKGFTAWLVHIRMPGAELDMGFYTQDPVAPARTSPRKKSTLTSQAH